MQYWLKLNPSITKIFYNNKTCAFKELKNQFINLILSNLEARTDWSLQAIVSFINSLFYNFSKFVAKILIPSVNSNNLSIKNSFDLVDRISNFKINENDFIFFRCRIFIYQNVFTCS